MMTTGTLDAVIKPFRHSSTTYSKDTDGQTKIPILTLDTTLDDLIGQKKDSPPALDSLRWNFPYLHSHHDSQAVVWEPDEDESSHSGEGKIPLLHLIHLGGNSPTVFGDPDEDDCSHHNDTVRLWSETKERFLCYL